MRFNKNGISKEFDPARGRSDGLLVLSTKIDQAKINKNRPWLQCWPYFGPCVHLVSWLIFGAWQWPPFLKGKKQNVWIENLKIKSLLWSILTASIGVQSALFLELRMNRNAGINISNLMQFNRHHQYFIESSPWWASMPIETAISRLHSIENY